MPTQAPVVYISSSAADAAFRDRLAAALERAEATIARGASESSATGLTPEAEQALVDSDAFVVLLSAAALASERVEREARRFHELRTTEPQRLLVPVLFAGVDPAALWPFLLGYTPLSAVGSNARNDEALIAEVLRRLDLLLEVDTVVVPAIPAPGAVPAGLDLTKVPPHVVVSGDVAAQDTAVLPAASAGARGNDITDAGTMAGSVHSRRSAPWGPTNRRSGILVLAGGLLALALCIALSLGILARGGHSGGHPGQHPAGAPNNGTNTAGQTPSLAATASPTSTATDTASPDPATTQGAGAPTATATATPTPVTQPGLWGDYYTSTPAGSGTPPPTYPAQNQLVCHEVDPNINYPTRKSFGCRSLTNNSKQTPTYAVKWYGYITVPTSGTYTFYAYSDDGVSVIVNGQQMIFEWTIHSPTWDCSTTRSGCNTITLQAGQLYPIELDYYENGDGSATMQLCWQAPDLQQDIIPPSAFSHA
ncbi:MAG TPA: PA14 domain-containing protein [Ktedonobacterales bacterium]